MADLKPNVKAYQFIEGFPSQVPNSQADDKENSGLTLQNDGGFADKADRPPAPSHIPPPSTPATRLPLADLIGNSEDTTRKTADTNVSPEDHIQWHAHKSPHGVVTPAQGKKRARSSSPPSSSCKEVSAHFESRGELRKPQAFKQPQKTPQTDPTLDLWNRYETNGIKDTPLRNQFAHLLNSSSPQTADDHGSNVSGLRRWTSCGMEWPSSKSKRRKTHHAVPAEASEYTLADLEAKDLSSDPAQPKVSRIGTLLERIQESLAKPKDPGESKGPSSSSPLPEREEQVDRKSISPCRASDLARRVQADREGYIPVEHEKDKILQGKSCDTSSSKFSSFDSEDLDMGPVKAQSWKPIDNSDGRQDINLEEAAEPEVNKTACLSDGDEFGDDEELSMADLENVALLYDNREATSGGTEVEREASASSLMVSKHPEKMFSSSAGDEFDDADIDEESFVAAEVAATQKCSDERNPKKAESDPKSSTIQRYLITDVSEGLYSTEKGQTRREKILLVSEEKTGLYKAVTLRESWFDTRCTKGSYVHIIGQFSVTGQCLIDDAQNMLILHPDHLISALVVADSFSCMRKAVLQDRIKATNESSPPMVYGTMLHEIFQEALKANRWDDDWLRQTIETVVLGHLEDLYEIHLSVEQVIDHLQSKMAELQTWAEIFVRESPKDNSLIQDRNGKQVRATINKLLDVEEHVWSPMYGLKGNIDATVQVVMQDDDGEKVLTVPLEVKTGRNSSNSSHRAQTALYTLLLSDRYDVAVAYGILYYLETSETSRIPAVRHELRHMIMQRNELACYVRERLSMPPMIKNTHLCNRCYAKTPCFLYHKLAEDGDGETSGMRNKFDEVSHHLKPLDQEFFKKWDDLLTKEESELMRFRRELWTMLSTEREKLGRCLANVVLDSGPAGEDPNSSKINRFQYTFRKQKNLDGFSFGESQISIGEPIVISDEEGHYALAKGYVTNISARHITVAVDRRLHNARTKQEGFNPVTNQVFAGMMDVGKETTPPDAMKQTQVAPILYRLDKDEFSNGMATVRNNLIQIMTNDGFRSQEIRGFIIEGLEPRFKPASSAYSISGPQSQGNVNEDQRAAIEKIMTAQDYALVLGMPGTGKTTTIAHIIRSLVAKGKSVLLTSYTHSAVDNILLKIRHDNIDILRLGAVAKVHPEVQEFAVLGGQPKTSIEQIEKAYQTPQVVATTCLGINHQVFKERIFDYCIVDEASQITLPVCLGPIRMAKVFVLVGDHYQLPPLVQNREAQSGGLDISLFKLLSERHPSAVATLHNQYRMNSTIMSICNTLIYSGRLKCGSAEIGNRTLALPTFSALDQLHLDPSSTIPQRNACPSHTSAACWLYRALDPITSPSVVFLNSDPLRPVSNEKAHGPRITNALEAVLCTQLISALLTAGVPAPTIGLITLYRSQLSLLKSLLRDPSYGISSSRATQIETHTADRYQGRDKDVVVISCVRNNERNIVGDLLKDWRRVNVAVTRARKKLIIVGSRGTLAGGDELLAKLVKLCDESGWMVDLPPNAADQNAHYWGNRSATPKQTSEVSVEHECESPETNRAIKKQEMTRPQSRTCQPLAPRTANHTRNLNPKFKAPLKVGSVPPHVALGGKDMREKRPILADIVYDIIGEDFLD